MVFILDGCSFHYAHTWSKSDNSICWRHLVTSKESSNPIFFLGKRPYFHHSCATWNEQPSNVKTMGKGALSFCSRIKESKKHFYGISFYFYFNFVNNSDVYLYLRVVKSANRTPITRSDLFWIWGCFIISILYLFIFILYTLAYLFRVFEKKAAILICNLTVSSLA